MPKASKKKDKEGLTPKQKKFYDVIKSFVKANGYAPSYEEMKNSMVCILKAMYMVMCIDS